jgi:membrane-associated phospholipid phosphatase
MTMKTSSTSHTSLIAGFARRLADRDNPVRYLPGKTVIVTTAAFGILGLLLLHAAGLSVSHLIIHLRSLAVALAIREFAIRLRLPSWIASLCMVFAMLILLTTIGICIGYGFTALSPFALRDHVLLEADHMLGFDWRAFVAIIDKHPFLCQALGNAYETIWLQLIAVIVYPAIRGDDVTADRAFLAISIAFVATGAISFLVPALGVTTLEPHDFAHLKVAYGIIGQQPYLALRAGKIHVIDLIALSPLITFPSFHAVVAVLMILVSRKIPGAFPSFLALNSLMLVSTFTHGGHYLSDVLIGSLIASASWGVATALIAPRDKRSPVVARAGRMEAVADPTA